MKTKPKLIYADHVVYGRGRVRAVRQLDGGEVFVADVKFSDGTQRAIRLAPEYWHSDVTLLINKALKLGKGPKRSDQFEDTKNATRISERRTETDFQEAA